MGKEDSQVFTGEYKCIRSTPQSHKHEVNTTNRWILKHNSE